MQTSACLSHVSGEFDRLFGEVLGLLLRLVLTRVLILSGTRYGELLLLLLRLSLVSLLQPFGLGFLRPPCSVHGFVST